MSKVREESYGATYQTRTAACWKLARTTRGIAHAHKTSYLGSSFLYPILSNVECACDCAMDEVDLEVESYVLGEYAREEDADEQSVFR